MKVNQVLPINRIGNAYQAYQKNSENQTKADGEKKAQVDQIELSSEAQIQLQAEKDKKIGQLKAQIENGTYQLFASAILRVLFAHLKSGAKVDE